MKLIIPELLYTGGEFKKEYAVMIEGTKIKKIGPAAELKKEAGEAELQQTGRFSSGETDLCIIIPHL